MKYSKAQQSILALYRLFYRACKEKKGIEREQAWQTIQETFRKNSKAVRRTELEVIDHLIRQGYKDLALFQKPGTTQIRTLRI